jgi:hypothetical protein
MGIPVFTDGSVWTAADVNTWCVPLSASKGSDENVTSSTALQNDNDLFLAVAASASYRVMGRLIYTGGTQGSSDLKISWTGPSGTTLLWNTLGQDTSGNTSWSNTHTGIGDTAALGTASGATRMVTVEGILTVGSTPGTFQSQWAQNTSSGTPTAMRTGSVLQAWRFA